MRLSTVTFTILLLSAAAIFASARFVSTAANPAPAPRAASSKQRNARRVEQPQRRRAGNNYTEFSHRTPQHRQASCSSCHTIPTPNWTRTRAREEAFPDVTDYPGHASCVDCHRRQFFSGARPAICTVCHTNVSPRDGTRHPFQNPQENFALAKRKVKTAPEFAVNFPHDLHQDVMASLPPAFSGARANFVYASWRQDASPKKIDSCSMCHQTFQPRGASDEKFVIEPPADLPKGAYWLKKGTFKTTPADHASCFNCHWRDGGEQPLSSDCAGCHKLLGREDETTRRRIHTDIDLAQATAYGVTDERILAKWLRRETATFRHEETKHENVGCTACHLNISAVNRLDENTLRVPLLTCGGSGTGCHIKPGVPKKILNIEVEKRNSDAAFQCTKCHLNYGRDPLPQSHRDAVSVAGTK